MVIKNNMYQAKKLCLNKRNSTDLFPEEPPVNKNPCPSRTPGRVSNSEQDEESPYFLSSTQEMNEEVDVLWDWNSPQTKPKSSIKKRSKKKLNLQNSPKVPLKRHASANEQMKQDFSRLREELKALKSEIAKPDDEESLLLSPREEESFKNLEDNLEPIIIEEDDFKDPFDDDMDDHLIFFSQQVESELLKAEVVPEKSNNHRNSRITEKNSYKLGNTVTAVTNSYKLGNTVTAVTKFKFSSRSSGENNIQSTGSSTVSISTSSGFKKDLKTCLEDSEVFNDSFDNVLSQIDTDDLDQQTQVVDIVKYKKSENEIKHSNKSKAFPRSQSEDVIATPQVASGKAEWQRTQSFENYSSIQRCSQDEIEQKRQQALAKLAVAKKQQELIQKNKQEALKRLAASRKKHTSQIKSDLMTKL